MKKMKLMSLAMALLLLCGCAARPVESVIGGADGPTAVIVGETVKENEGESESVILTCRVVAEEDGALTLAELGGNGVYTLNTSGIEVLWERSDGEREIEEGSLIDIVYSGVCAECWPMIPGGVTEIRVRADGFDDMCAMYLDVLEDLWEEDPGLNGEAEYVSVYLKETSLSPSEQAAVAWLFGGECGVFNVLELSLDELHEQGYITEEENGFTHWKEGVYFAITEEEMEGIYNGVVPVQFDAWKWRSSLGAYFFSDCTSARNGMGEWSDYQVGAHMIS